MRGKSNGEYPVIIKVCSLCDKVQKYNRGDTLPHWEKLTEQEWHDIIKRGYREHHTLCPECRQRKEK